MRYFSVALLLLMAAASTAGTVNTTVEWITQATEPGDTVANNDDFVGLFRDNPNKFGIRLFPDFEYVIPTQPSEGTTEYAFTFGGAGKNYDNVYQVQLGFGLGESFVTASEVGVDLRFDLSENVSPAIEEYYPDNPWKTYPRFWLTDHAASTLTFQGSSNDGWLSHISFHDPHLFKVPLDVPDLELSTRDYYSAAELSDIPANDRPFTVRMMPLYGHADLNLDGLVDDVDIDLLTQKAIEGTTDSNFDLDRSGNVDLEDRRVWVTEMLNTYFGDSNLDREFGSADLTAVLAAGQYEDGIPENSRWANGDWNADLEFDTSDLVTAFVDGGYEQGRRSPGPWVDSQAVPESASPLMLVIALLGLQVVSRRNGRRPQHVRGSIR